MFAQASVVCLVEMRGEEVHMDAYSQHVQVGIPALLMTSMRDSSCPKRG